MAERLRLPEAMQAKVRSFPEFSMGAHRIALVLRSGEKIDNVIVAWGEEVVRVGDGDPTELSLDEVVDVIDRSDATASR